MSPLKNIKDYIRNPLGIIALFISLIYGIAALLLNSSIEKLQSYERQPLIWFVVIFPTLILFAFYKLVTEHHGKLYAPSDYKDDNSFLRTLSHEEKEEKLSKELNEILPNNIEVEPAELFQQQETNTPTPENSPPKESIPELKEEIFRIENSAIQLVAKEYNTIPRRDIGIGGTQVTYDAFIKMEESKPLFLEVKYLRFTKNARNIIDKIALNATIANNQLSGNFKLLVIFVHSRNTNIETVRNYFEDIARQCNVEMNARFIEKQALENI